MCVAAKESDTFGAAGLGVVADKIYLTDQQECDTMPYRPGDPTFEIEAQVETSTAKAYLIYPTMGAKKEVWLPKSQVVEMSEPNDNGLRTFTVTEWWYGVSGLADD